MSRLIFYITLYEVTIIFKQKNSFYNTVAEFVVTTLIKLAENIIHPHIKDKV